MTKPRRFNANQATQAVLTLSAALLCGLGFRLGDAALSKSMSSAPKAAPAVTQPAVNPPTAPKAVSPTLKTSRPSNVRQAQVNTQQVTARPAQPAKPKVSAAAPVQARVVYVTKYVTAAAPPRNLQYASYRSHDGEHEDGEEGDDEGESAATYRPATTVRNVSNAAPVRVVAVQAARPQPVRVGYVAPVRPRVVRPIVRAVPSRTRYVAPAPARTATRPQAARPRFTAQPPRRARATTRGS